MISVPVGTIIGGSYRVLAPRLALSADADVYFGEVVKKNAPVLVVFLREHLPKIGPAREAFEREARALFSFKHPGLVELLDFGLLQNTPFLVLAQPLGEPIEDQIAALRGNGGHAVRAIAALYNAIEGAHARGLVHGNLDTTSLFIAPDGRPIIWDLAVVHLRRVITNAPTPDTTLDRTAVATFARFTLIEPATEKKFTPRPAVKAPPTPPHLTIVSAPSGVEGSTQSPTHTPHASMPAHLGTNAFAKPPSAALNDAPFHASVPAHPGTNGPLPIAPAQHPPRPSPPVPTRITQAIAEAQNARPAQFARIARPTPATATTKPQPPAPKPRTPIDDEPSVIAPLEPAYITWLRTLFSRNPTPLQTALDTGLHLAATTSRRRSFNLAVTCAVALALVVLFLRA